MPREHLPEINFEGLHNLLKTKELSAHFSQHSFLIRLHPPEENGLFYSQHFFQKNTGQEEIPRFALQKSRYFGHVDDLPGLWLLDKSTILTPKETTGEPDFFNNGIQKYVLVPVAAFSCPFAWWACPVEDDGQAVAVFEKCIFPFNEWAGYELVNHLLRKFTPFVLKTSGWTQEDLSNAFATALNGWFLPKRCTVYSEEYKVLHENGYGLSSNHTADLSLSLCNGYTITFSAGAYQLPSGLGPIHQFSSFQVRQQMLKEQLEGIFALLYEICFPVQSVGMSGDALLQEAIRRIDSQKESLEVMAAELSGLRKDLKAVVANDGRARYDYAFFKTGDKWEIYFEGKKVGYKGNPNKGLTAIWMILEANGEEVPGDDLRLRPLHMTSDPTIHPGPSEGELPVGSKAKARKSGWDKKTLTEEIIRLLKSAKKEKDLEEALKVYQNIKNLGQILRQLGSMNWRKFNKICADEIKKIDDALEMLGKKPDSNYAPESDGKIQRKGKNEGTTRPIRLFEDVNKNIDYALNALEEGAFKKYLKPPVFIHSDVSPFRHDPSIPPKRKWQFYAPDEMT